MWIIKCEWITQPGEEVSNICLIHIAMDIFNANITLTKLPQRI